MTNWTTRLALIAAVSTGSLALSQQVLAQEADAAEAVAEASRAVVGALVLPEELPANVKAEDLDLTKLQGSVVRQLPRVPVPYPENWAFMSDEEKKAWATEFRKSPEYKEFVKKSRARMREQRQQKRMPVSFDKDGGFKVKGLEPGTYMLSASIPHPKSERQKIAQFSKAFEVKADQPVLTLEKFELTVNTVLVPGDVAPDFTAQAYDGKTFKLSDYRGKYVLIDFWATWCGPCIAEMPNLKAVYKDYAGEQFEMIALSLDKSIDLPKQFAEKNPSDYVQGYLGDWSSSEVPKQYGVRGIPSIWLIGPDGKIVARDLRGQRLREEVKKAVEGSKGVG